MTETIDEILTNIDEKLQELNKTDKIKELIYKEKNVSKNIDIAMKKMNELKKKFNQDVKPKKISDDENIDEMIDMIVEEINEISEITDIEEQIECYRKLKRKYLACKEMLDGMKSEKIYCDEDDENNSDIEEDDE